MPRARCRTANEGGDIRPIRKPETIVALLLVIIATFGVAQVARAQAPTGPTGEPIVERVKPCTVNYRTYNRLVTKYDALTGHHRFKRRGHPVPCAKYRKLRREVKEARADCLRKAQRTEASVYWPGADSGGMIGSCGWHLSQFTYAYAELGMGTYLGRLPCGTKLYMHGPNGETVRGPKVDIGYGSGSSNRGIDLWNRTGPAIGIGNGIGMVTVSRRNCWA